MDYRDTDEFWAKRKADPSTRPTQQENFKKQIDTTVGLNISLCLITLLGVILFSQLVSCTAPELDPQTKWNNYYENIDTSVDTTVDVEVMRLREQLEPHGMSVIRVNPDNPEHQRRYRRHLLGNTNPSMEITDYQRHEKHATQGSYGTNCTWCRKEILNSMANKLSVYANSN